MLDIRLLGPPEVVVDGRPLEVDTRKAIALVAYLAVEGGSSRDTLAALLWAESSTERARATLRRTLSSLRTGAGPGSVVSDRDRVMLDPDALIDIREFESEIEATTAHAHQPGDVCADCIPYLARATALYRGEFLAGFMVREAPEFESWARNVSESLRLKVADATQRLAVAQASIGGYRVAISSARRWIDLDELHEPAHRLLMLLHAWSGDRPGAIEAYRSFVGILDRELSVPPLSETTELYEAILDDDLPPAPGARRRVRAEPTAPSPRSDQLLDRELEMSTLRGWWEQAQQEGHVAVVGGGPWMGKTRLLEELSNQVRAEGQRALVGRAYRTEQGLPYGVATQILRGGADLIEESGDSIPTWALEEASRLIPGARRDESGTGDRFGELRLLEGLYETVAAMASHGPLLIVIDDAQWLDPASASFVAYLGRRVEGLPILLVLVVRQGEATPAPILDLVRSADRLTLVPLTVTDIVGALADPEEATAIVARTGGVPLLVREMIDQGMQEENGSVLRYLELRLSDLTDLGRQVLTTAAVLTGICEVTLLREVSGRSEVEVVEAVEELVGSGLMRDLPESPGLGLTLEALERTAYQSISMARRRLLHRRAAEALSSKPGAARDLRLAAAIAGQFQGAGDDRAGDWFRLAGDLARSVYANEEATSFYQSAEALGAAEQAQIRLALGELAMARGDYPIAIQELTMAAMLAKPDSVGRVEHRLGELHRLLGRFEAAGEQFARAVTTHPHPATVYADWAMLHRRMGDEGAARSCAVESLRTAESGGDPHVLSRAENVSGVVASDRASALAHFDRALALAGPDDLARMAALNNKAHALASSGDIETAYPLVEQAIEIAASTGHRHREAALRNHLADLHHRSGRTDEAREESMRAVSLFAGIDAGSWEPEVWLLTSW